MQVVKQTFLYFFTFVAGALAILLLIVVGWVSLPQPADQPLTQGGELAPNMPQSTAKQSDDKSSFAQQSESTSVSVAQLKQIQSDIAKAALQRNALSAQLDTLNDAISVLQKQQIEQTEQLSLGSSSSAGDQAAQLDSAARATRPQQRRGRLTSQDQFESLVSAGVDESVARTIKQQQDRFELERLNLVDQATREGWRGSERFRTAMTELAASRNDLREELGDDVYDNYLYSSGAENRVSIANIIEGSAAQIAGMEIGDIVLQYAGQSIYRSNELQQATREGVRGEPVLVLLERGGSRFNTEVPRGPLGVSLEGATVQPSAF